MRTDRTAIRQHRYGCGRAGLVGPDTARRGLTLVELLIAMAILLIGVYAIAALFPKLSRNIGEEETRTTMSRATQRVAEQFRSGTYNMPQATAPYYTNVDVVEPWSKPEDPDSNNTADNPFNSRDDFIEVFGEQFTVPAPPSAGGYPCYVPEMGLIETVHGVRELRPLEEAWRDPGANGSVGNGEYYLRHTGELIFNSPQAGAAGAIIYYDWLDGSVMKHVPGEFVGASNTSVQAVARGGTVVPGSEKVYAVYNWSWTIGPPASPTGRRCWIDALAGQAVYFPPSAAGKELQIDYRVRREDLIGGGANPRRALIMQEDEQLPSTDPFRMELTFEGLDDEDPLVMQALDGTDVPDVWLMVVDKLDGTTWVWDENSDGSGPIANVDFVRSAITFNSADVVPRAGDPVRVYYRTLDDDTIQVQKVPGEFVEVGQVPPNVPNWQHRRYRVGFANGYCVLHDFPTYTEGQAVEVDYAVNVGGATEHVVNELHVISDLGDPSLGFGFALSEANVTGVLSVEGVSMRVVGWWRTETGRVGRYHVANIVFPGS